MAITPENIACHEIIGLNAKVIKCSDGQKEGISGEVLDETRDTLNVEGKRLVKKNCRFLFEIPGDDKVEVEGNNIVARPEDRTRL